MNLSKKLWTLGLLMAASTCLESVYAISPASLVVEENIGQHQYGSRYVMKGKNYHLAFDRDAFHIYFKEGENKLEKVTIQFVGGSSKSRLRPITRNASNVSYYNGPNANQWFENVPVFQKLSYQNLYEGIDVHFYGNKNGQIEFDFVLAPGADPSQISMRSKDGTQVEMDHEGNLVLDKKIIISSPTIYQEIENAKTVIPGDFSAGEGGVISFDLGNFDPEHDLVIDPVITYSSYFGGAGASESVADMAVDDEGFVYITGTSSFSGQFYIAKFLPGASDFELIQWYGTGMNDTRARHIILDHDDNIIVDVTTRDPGLPVQNAIQPGFGGIIDIYLVKLKPSGERTFATYIGGASDFPNITPLDLRGREYSSGVIVDADNNIFLSGETDGRGFPTTGNALEANNIGNWDLFLMKFSPLGGLLYSTFLGGFENDRINTGSNAEEALAIDSLGRVYFMGYTANPLEDYPSSGSPIDGVFTDDTKHVLIVFDSKNSTFIYSSFLDEFEPAFLKVDGLNRVHLAGRGQWNEQVNPISNTGDQYAMVLKPLSNEVVFSSHIPCTDCEIADIHVGTNNHLFFAAYDRDPGSVVSDSLPEFSRLKRNAYVGQIDVDKSELVFSLLIGGNENDTPEGLFVSDDLTKLYLSGVTRSTDFYTTPDALNNTYQGGGDVFVTILELGTSQTDAIYLDANPDFIGTGFFGLGKVNNIKDITDVEELINAVRTDRIAVVADGVSEVLIKVPFPQKVTIAQWDIEEKYGSIETPWSNSTHEIDEEHYFFALYRPPEEFPEDGDKFKINDIEASKAPFKLDVVTADGDLSFNFEIDLVRPPVVLVHGTFDNPENCWNTSISPAANNMVQALELAGFKVFTVDYSDSNGKLDDLFFSHEGIEQSRFASNKRVVYENDGGIEEAIDYYRDDMNVAATQADVIGHSMGGVLPRVFAAHENYDTEYKRDNNFMEGDIHRMISIASTHSGSELSDFLGFIGEDDFVNGFPFIEKFINESVVFATYFFGGIGDTGAVQDQRPMSPALKKIGKTTVPSHAIVCTVDDLADLKANAGEPAEFATYYNFLRALTLIFYFNNATLKDFITNLAERHHRLPDELKNANEKPSIFVPLASDKVSELRKPSNRDEFIEMFNFPLNRIWFMWHLIMEAVFDDWFTTEEGVLVTQYETTEINYGDFDDNLQTQIQNENWDLIRGEVLEPFPNETNRSDEVVDFFRYLIFKNAANDCVVRYESQTGGLESPYITEFENHIHSYAPRYPDIINRCIIILKSGNQFFSEEGFPEAGKDMPIEIPDPMRIEVESVVDENTYTGCEAACWSGMVPSHAFVFAEVADILNMVILARPVNPDATAVIEANNATKPMNLKGKSSNWGPQRAFIAQDQRFSKLWFQYEEDKVDERDAEIAKYDAEVVKSINDPAKIAVFRNLEKTYTCDSDVGDYKVFFDSMAMDPVQAIYFEDGIGSYRQWIKSVDDECEDKEDCCPLSEEQVFPSNLKPMRVLANPQLLDEEGRPRFYTADYDLLAMAQYARSLGGLEEDPYTDAPAHDEKYIPRFTPAEFDSEKGYITPEQNTIVDFINNEIKNEAGYEGGRVTHHGPENQYYIVDKPKKGSPYVDYPITAFEPDFSRFSDRGIIRSIPKGPPGFRDRYLKRYMAKMRRKGYNLYPNLVANGWQWDYHETYSYGKGWDDRDAPELDSGPEEIPFPKFCNCDSSAPGLIEPYEELLSEARQKPSIENLYPNPSTGFFKVTLINPDNQLLEYSIHDLTGRVIKMSKIYLTKGLGNLTVNIEDLETGMYIFQMRDESGKSSSLKFVKQKTN